MRTFLKFLLAAAIIGVTAIVLTVVAVRSFVKTVNVKESGHDGQKTVNVDSPFGHFELHENDKLDPEMAGIAIYPGAVRSKERGGVSFQIDAGNLHKDMTASGAVYYTDDGVDRVQDYYRSKLTTWNRKDSDKETTWESKDSGQIRSISVRREGGRTRISVASVGPPASN